ncbi:hypothetical protein PUNSTDRAFT_68258 [Punctularia strigosozonata HHB-11173 SS5]|uniref:uncharacterized protein n=1 Tax=Punctularia strigosozonata (strain HHB-11173) TaxID=741275 RepID=UPI0004417C07|nr:uncharacterized protein PUNSTDRAFT_68258 [Punctularia strigosozonata HHB-11173 SS5]EIN09024.1 hypothetical protein PUNSTDRAFT_68258 [Punctularia strigosozonata HHB-11173 SS5]
MQETSRLLEAAAALSRPLRRCGIAHAFHGSILPAVLSSSPTSDEMYCLVSAGPGGTHPFGRVSQALAGNEYFTVISSPWCNRRRLKIEILPAGEEGPRHLDGSTVMVVRGTPFLTVSEFLRAKLKAWSLRRSEHDASDISFVLARYWNQVDLNRIPEQDMRDFIRVHKDAASAWAAIKRKYGA